MNTGQLTTLLAEVEAVRVEIGSHWSVKHNEKERGLTAALDRIRQWLVDFETAPTPMLLWCPECGTRHIDEGEFATKPHRAHACQNCGMVWRPAIEATVGVRHLPGFKNEEGGA